MSTRKKRPFFLITGPPAVGKMTVGQELARRCDFKLLHNHMSIELALQMFDFGDLEFKIINNGIRQLVLNTLAHSENIKGAMFTLVWSFESERDWKYVEDIKDQFSNGDWNFHVIELVAPMEIRKQRNNTPNRLEHKPSKRDIAYSENNIDEFYRKFRLTSDPGELDGWSYLRIDNSNLEVEDVVSQIIAHFNLDVTSD